MPALSYKERFVEPVLAGLRGDPDGKTQSIRAFRKYPVKVGDTLYHYFAQRSKWCKKLGESIAKEVYKIRITAKYIRIWYYQYDIVFTNDQLNAFANRDGFTDWADMVAFWKEEHGKKKKKKSPFPFVGQLIKW